MSVIGVCGDIVQNLQSSDPPPPLVYVPERAGIVERNV